MAALADPASLNAHLADKSYVSGFVYGSEDKKIYEALTAPPAAAQYPHAFRWFKHVSAALGKPVLVSSAPHVVPPQPPVVPPGAPTPAYATSVAPATEDLGVPEGFLPRVAVSLAGDKDARGVTFSLTTKGGDTAKMEPVAAPAGDDMCGDDLFGDDGDEAEAAPAMSLAEKAKAAKAAREAKKKKDKIEKSQVLIEVKPWEADQDLPALYAKICAEVTPEGLQWGEAFKLEEVGYGIKKLVMSCVIEDEKVMTDDFLEPIGEMEDEVQSVDMLTMNRL